VDLDWADAARAVSYDVYFGPSNPPPLVPGGARTSSDLPLTTLSSGATYYWRVEARNNAGTTIGPLWRFTTQVDQTPTWRSLGSGMNLKVNAVTVYNGQLIAAGFFTTACGPTRNRIATLNGAEWQALG